MAGGSGGNVSNIIFHCRSNNLSMSQIFDILHKMDINWSIIKEYLNKEDQMLADNSRYVKRKMILLSFVQNLEKLISIYTLQFNFTHVL